MTDPIRSSAERPRSLSARRRRGRRVLVIGLLISVAVHLVVISAVGRWLEPEAERVQQPAEPVIVEPPRGIRAIRLAEADAAADAAEPDEPERERTPEPEPVTEAPPAIADTRSAPADTLSAADRLAPRVVDPRLWRPMVLLPREPTLEDVEARIAAAVELLGDSALAAAEAAVRARDWTVEDESGGRWGISPGKLHLGQLTLPLPIWFPVDPEAATEARRWYELDEQLERARVLETFEERVRAIRERRDREREEQRAGENGGG